MPRVQSNGVESNAMEVQFSPESSQTIINSSSGQEAVIAGKRIRNEKGPKHDRMPYNFIIPNKKLAVDKKKMTKLYIRSADGSMEFHVSKNETLRDLVEDQL